MKRPIKNLLLGLIIISAIGGQDVLAADYDLNTYVYKHLEDWDTEFQISYYKSDVLDLVKNIAKKDDYLSLDLERLVYERVGDSATLKVTYKTTKEQEEYINQKLQEIINSITNSNMSDFKKIKVINDYLINRYEYDYSLASNNPYTALTTGKTTCQGYAMTAYKMLNLAGIENRIVIGELDGVAHGWNLVKLNNKWYHLDITNNDVLDSDKFFLKNDECLRSSGFSWNSNEYPRCDENYDVTINNGNREIDNHTSMGYRSNLDGSWNFVNNSWYFFKKIGSYATGWNLIDNNWYYLGYDGVMKTGWIYSSGKWYYCYPNSGLMAINTIIDGYRVDSTGEWIS